MLAQFRDPLLLLAAIAIAIVAWWIEGRVGWPVDAVVIAVVVLPIAALGHAQEAKADAAVATLAQIAEVTSAVPRGGRAYLGHANDLARGDAGDRQLASDIRRFVADMPVPLTRRQAMAVELRRVLEQHPGRRTPPIPTPTASTGLDDLVV